MDKQLEHYLLNLLPHAQPWIIDMENHAKDHHIPIMDPLSMNYLANFIQIIQPKKILEIGTAIGYSALRMYEAYPRAEITTIERDPLRYEQAKENIRKYKQDANINVIFGDGREILLDLATSAQKYDFVLIDAAKAQYQTFFERSHPLVKQGGVIATDNVLFKGYVANRDNGNQRHQKIAKKIDRFNRWLVDHPQYSTTIIPIGDGLAISYKIGHNFEWRKKTIEN